MKLDLEEAKTVLNNILVEWDHLSGHLDSIDEEESEEDLFARLDSLIQIEESKGIIAEDIEQIEKYLQDAKESVPKLQAFKTESERVFRKVRPQLEKVEEMYEELLEETLYDCQDRIEELVDCIVEHRDSYDVKGEIEGELDEENELLELRNSLDIYREIRLENVGQEGSDPILNQLDSLLVSCDSGLVIDELNL